MTIQDKIWDGFKTFIACVIGLVIGNWLFSKGCASSQHKPKSDTTITIHNGKSDTIIKITK